MRYLHDRLDDNWQSMSGSDLSLVEVAQRCFEAMGDDLWEELIYRLQPVFSRAAYRVAMQWGSANVRDIDDIVQETCFKLVAQRNDIQRLPEGNDDAALVYFRVMAANCAHDYFRAKYASKRGQGKTDDIEARLDELASEIGIKQMEAQIMMIQVDALLKTSDRDRAIFWLYYRQGLTAKEIATSIENELSDKGVESLIRRLTAGLRASLNRKEEKPA
jgi:RNA polymerase sigma-70 factor, ECF subfamily